MPALIHRLTPAPQLQGAAVVCGDPAASVATWEDARVTCPACLAPRRRAGPGPTERHLQEQIRQACALQGWLYYHTHNSRDSPAGYPDVTAVRGERLVYAELKRAGQRLTPAQEQWLQALDQVREVEVYLWRPDDLARALEVFR